VTDLPPSPPPPPAPPQPPVQPPQPPREPHRDLLTPGMIEALRLTKPWVRFLSILGFVSVGFMLLVAAGMVVFGVVQMAKAGAEGAVLLGMAAVYVVFAILYLFPSRYLYQYASAIERVATARFKSPEVEQALRLQKSFWKFAGIMALVMLVLYIPILLAIALPNLLNAMGRSKQKRTLADIRTIASAVEARATDVNSYPLSMTMDELARELEPTYAKSLPRVDGWGKPFVYEGVNCDDECQEYFVASGGGNGVLERERPSAYGGESVLTTDADEDIVITAGGFVRAPEGVPPQN